MNEPSVLGDLVVKPLCRLVRPPLTSLSRDIPAYGAHAVARLLDIIGGVPVASVEDEAPHVTPRGSTGRPSASPLPV